MKLLITGLGNVGTIYGWALSESGADVTHVVRQGKRPLFEGGLELDVLDLREGRPETYKAVYRPEVVEPQDLSPDDGFEMLVVATKESQATDAVRQYRDLAPGADILMFAANWEGTRDIDELIPRSRYLWGYSAASGGRKDGIYYINVRDDYRIGELDGGVTPRLESIIDVFGNAGLKPDLKDNIIEWLSVHYAVNAGTIGTALFAGGIQGMEDPGMSRMMVSAVLECLEVLKKRGVDVTRYPDTKPFLELPAEVAAERFKRAFIESPIGKRSMSVGHFTTSPDEMRQYYRDVLETGLELGVDMPVMSSMKERILGW